MEGGKNQITWRKTIKAESSREINYNNSTHISSKFENQHRAIPQVVSGHPSSYNPVQLDLTVELCGETQQANCIRPLYSL